MSENQMGAAFILGICVGALLVMGADALLLRSTKRAMDRILAEALTSLEALYAQARADFDELDRAQEINRRRELARTIGAPGTGQTRPSGEPFTAAAEPKEPLIDEGN